MATNGLVVFLTGINGAGKDTLAPLLAEQLDGWGGLPARFVYAPKISPAAAAFRAAVLEGTESRFAELLGFMAQHAEAAAVIARQRTERPEHTVINRGPETALVYNGYANFTGQDVELEVAGAIYEQLMRQFYWGSLTVLLDVTLETSRRRSAQQGETDHIQDRGDDYYERMIEAYHEQAVKGAWLVVNANTDGPEKVVETIWTNLRARMEDCHV